MERVSEALPLPVIVQGGRPLALELQPLEKLDFFCGRAAAEGRVLQEFLESRLFASRLFESKGLGCLSAASSPPSRRSDLLELA